MANNDFKVDAALIIPIIMLFIPGIRWVGVYLLWKKLRDSNVLPKKGPLSLGSLCIGVGVILFVAKFAKVIAATVLIAGGAVLGIGLLSKRRENRDKRYQTVVGDQAAIPLKDLASVMGVSQKKIVKELQSMIDRGCFGPNAYIDQGKRLLVVRPSDLRVYAETAAAEAEAEAPKAEKVSPFVDAAFTGETVTEDEYDRYLMKINDLNDQIADKAVSEKIERIRRIAADIFAFVRNHPDRKPQIRGFMNYYLPTTCKILSAYAELEKQSVEGQNIRGAKEKIEGILDALIEAYRQQLDLLFQAKAMDVTTDIDVLETMMAKDGFSGLKMRMGDDRARDVMK